jgi:hypothetical protein
MKYCSYCKHLKLFHIGLAYYNQDPSGALTETHLEDCTKQRGCHFGQGYGWDETDYHYNECSCLKVYRE